MDGGTTTRADSLLAMGCAVNHQFMLDSNRKAEFGLRMPCPSEQVRLTEADDGKPKSMAKAGPFPGFQAKANKTGKRGSGNQPLKGFECWQSL